MKFEVLTLFPEAIEAFAEHGLLGKAIQAGHIKLNCVNYRQYSADKHGRLDDIPYGGGAGMVMEPGPVLDAMQDLQSTGERPYYVMLSPSGEPFTQAKAQALSQHPRVAFLCGRYEGIDDRVRESHVDACYSLGDFVLNGGEVAALAMIESVARLVPGVLGNPESVRAESFAARTQGPLLEYPQYTRPVDFRGVAVPELLRSGDHARISAWRQRISLLRTWMLRPDLRSHRPLAVAPTGTFLLDPALQAPQKEELRALAQRHGWNLCWLGARDLPGDSVPDLRRFAQRKRRQGREIALMEYRPQNWVVAHQPDTGLTDCWSNRCSALEHAAQFQWIVALEAQLMQEPPKRGPVEPVLLWSADPERAPDPDCAKVDLHLGVAAAPLGIDLALCQRMIESPESVAPWAAIRERVDYVLRAHASMAAGTWRPPSSPPPATPDSPGLARISP